LSTFRRQFFSRFGLCVSVNVDRFYFLCSCELPVLLAFRSSLFLREKSPFRHFLMVNSRRLSFSFHSLFLRPISFPVTPPPSCAASGAPRLGQLCFLNFGCFWTHLAPPPETVFALKSHFSQPHIPPQNVLRFCCQKPPLRRQTGAPRPYPLPASPTLFPLTWSLFFCWARSRSNPLLISKSLNPQSPPFCCSAPPPRHLLLCPFSLLFSTGPVLFLVAFPLHRVWF